MNIKVIRNKLMEFFCYFCLQAYVCVINNSHLPKLAGVFPTIWLCVSHFRGYTVAAECPATKLGDGPCCQCQAWCLAHDLRCCSAQLRPGVCSTMWLASPVMRGEPVSLIARQLGEIQQPCLQSYLPIVGIEHHFLHY